MKEIQDRLFAAGEQKYGDFISSLTPGIDRSLIIGVRVPVLRRLAKEIKRNGQESLFTEELPHKYYEENLLHSILLSGSRELDRCIAGIDAFLPYVDNWCVCDTLSPGIFSAHRDAVLPNVLGWIGSQRTYTVRFGLHLLMSLYLDEDFRDEYPRIAAGIRSDEYYVNMMTAWYFATALAKQWDSIIPFLETRSLPDTVHAMTIRKARESRRITDAQKAYLLTLK